MSFTKIFIIFFISQTNTILRFYRHLLDKFKKFWNHKVGSILGVLVVFNMFKNLENAAKKTILPHIRAMSHIRQIYGIFLDIRNHQEHW